VRKSKAIILAYASDGEQGVDSLHKVGRRTRLARMMGHFQDSRPLQHSTSQKNLLSSRFDVTGKQEANLPECKS
jgi:hypothetical protein